MEPTSKDQLDQASALQEAVETDPETVDVDDIVDILVRGDQETRRVAFDAYQILVGSRSAAVDDAIARLEIHLTDDSTEMRRRAALTASVLVELHPEAFERVVPELRAIGDEMSEPGREQAVLALAKLGIERPAAAVPAVDTLLEICHDSIDVPDGSADVRGVPNAGPDRGAALKQEREHRTQIRVHAIAGLTRIAAEDTEAVRESVSDVAALLEDDNHHVRAGACEVLESVATAFPGDVGPFASALATRIASDTSHPVPWRAADALVALEGGRPEQVGDAVAPIADDLSRFLESRDVERRRVGISLLSSAANVRPSAIEPMVPAVRELLADDDTSVRANAALVLGLADDSDAHTALTELAESDPDTNVREAADRSLERLERTNADGR